MLLQGAYLAMKATGGKLFVFQTGWSISYYLLLLLRYGSELVFMPIFYFVVVKVIVLAELEVYVVFQMYCCFLLKCVIFCWDCLCCCSFTVSGTWCTDSKGGRRQDWREGNS
jgi:hypothetical protein